MASSAAAGRSLEETPTWAVAVVCVVLVLISIVIEHTIHLIGKWLKKKRKRALYEALEKIKSELMLLGFISLLLTVGQGLITSICISEKLGSTWHPCSKQQEEQYLTTADYTSYETHHRRRKLLSSGHARTYRRVLATASGDKCSEKGMVPFVSSEGIHQLHIFIFVLAVFHVINCIFTMTLGRAKMRKWKAWERETRTDEYRLSESLRYVGETSFGRRHLNLWTKKPLLMWIVCFFRHFVKFVSVAKVDYLTLRHGFIMAHLAPQSHAYFDFQKYIKRSLEDDFKVTVGLNPFFWFFAVIFLLTNTHGWYAYLWLPFIPLIMTVLVGTKLQAIVTKMGLKIEERGEIVKGVPVVQPGDHLFWFNRPRLMLHLISFIMFQNAFQLAFFTWTWYEFGIKSCFHDRTVEIIVRISMGVFVQVLCSYITLPLYALVTQMGSTMKPAIFNERVAMALKNWHRSARKQIRESRRGSSVTPTLSMCHRPSSVDSPETISPRRSSFDTEQEEDVQPRTLSTQLADLLERDHDIPSSSIHGDGDGFGEEENGGRHRDPELMEIVVVPMGKELVRRTKHEITEIEPSEHDPDSEFSGPTVFSESGGDEDRERQEAAMLQVIKSIVPTAQSANTQHEIEIELIESIDEANEIKGGKRGEGRS